MIYAVIGSTDGYPDQGALVNTLAEADTLRLALHDFSYFDRIDIRMTQSPAELLQYIADEQAEE